MAPDTQRRLHDASLPVTSRWSIKPDEFNLQCSDGTVRRYVWYQRYDPEEQLMYMAGEEANPETGR